MSWRAIIIPAVTLSVAFLGNAFTRPGLFWYQSILTPAWAPSGAVIGWVWSALYILATASALRVYRNLKGIGRNRILCTFALNAVLNATWSFTFFGLHDLLGGAIHAGLLALSVYALMALAWKHERISAWLLAPYAAWTTFAAYLAATIWSMNR